MRQAVHTTVVAVARKGELQDASYLKGGILLALRYGSIRHTRDIDFSNSSAYSDERGQDVLDALTSALPEVVEELGYDLDCKLQGHDVHPSPHHSYVNLRMRIGYAAKGSGAHRRMRRGQAPETLIIDYNFRESVPEQEWVEVGPDSTIRVYGLTTLIAEKYRAMLQQARRNRTRRQDVYDLNFLLESCGVLERGARCRILKILLAKCQDRDFMPQADSMADAEVRRRAEAEYETLDAEVEGDLPSFGASFARVRRFYERLPWD